MRALQFFLTWFGWPSAHNVPAVPSSTTVASRLRSVQSIPIQLSRLLNNKGVSAHGECVSGGFDGSGATIAAEFLPTGVFLDEGISFDLPQSWTALKHDNIVAEGQTIDLLVPVETSSIHLLVAGDGTDGETTETLVFRHADGTSSTGGLDLKHWWALHWLNKASIRGPYHFSGLDGHRNYNVTHLHHVTLPLVHSSPLVSIQLPERASYNALHVFAISIVPVSPHFLRVDSPLQIKRVRATRKWADTISAGRAQVVEITVVNAASLSNYDRIDAWIAEPIELSVTGRGLKTVQGPGVLHRLMPGDETVVSLLVQASSLHDGSRSIELIAQAQDRLTSPWVWTGDAEGSKFMLEDGFADWTDNPLALEAHEAPDWYAGAKFGIFIHFGLYSVPAWMDQGRYAEWYGWWLHKDGQGSKIYDHHLKNYGHLKYDEFMSEFDGSRFDPREWIDLFGQAGAKYFVLTTKHHDGIALFDAQHTSNRSTVSLGPDGGKDYLRELFDAADASEHSLKRGTYYSLPEFWNPMYTPYGWEGFPGGLAENIFHDGKLEPYTGSTEIKDYVEDLQLEQMRILARDYKIDLLWCDIGGANHTSLLASEWYRNATVEGRAVTMNNRCGVAPDFATPEYQLYENVQPWCWETCEGIDPHSFGYNRATRDDEYRSAREIIHKIADITSTGGNYLLNVGPTGKGEIIQAQQVPLRQTGAWLNKHGHAIYNTTTFPLLPKLRNPDLGLDLRFTRTSTSFFIISLSIPLCPIFRIPARLPILERDSLLLVGRDGTEVVLDWVFRDGELRIFLEQSDLDPDQHAWVFEVRYGPRA